MSKITSYTVALYFIAWWTSLLTVENYQFINLLFLSISIISLLIAILFYFKKSRKVIKQ